MTGGNGGNGFQSSSSGKGSGSGGAGGSTSSGEGTGGSLLAGTAGTGSTCDTHCSSDLHSVVDCNGTVVSTCPADQGCGAAGCVSACDAAKENKSTVGCDYYAVDPPIITDAAGACYAAFIANTWTSPVSITVERQGTTFDVSTFARIPVGTGQSLTYQPLPSGMLDPGQVAILFLSGSPNAPVGACPAGITPADASGSASTAGTGLGAGFHITTSAPVVGYDIFPFGGGQSAATSATLLIPTTAWDVNYIAIDPYAASQLAQFEQAYPGIVVVAAEDDTQVSILPTVAIEGGNGVSPAPAGATATYTLNKGQTLTMLQSAELIGSPIQSNKPIGLMAAASCLNVPVDVAACDSAHQQIPPVKAFGSEYVAARYRDRFDGQEESVPWRIVGAVDGTTLTYEPAAPTGAPTSLNLGQVAEFRDPGPFVVKSQDASHPFYVAGYMTGCQETNPSQNDCRGDPEFVNVLPSLQYLSSYVFFTDPTYPETDLVLVRTNTGAGFKDVTLDCAGVLTGWTAIGTSGKYEYTRIDLVRHNFAPQNGCDNGRHEIHSDAPFGLTVWGWGSAETGGFFGVSGQGGFYSQAVSYAYPGGASVQPINTVVVPTVPK